MPFFPRSSKEIVSKSLQRLSTNTNINQLSPGGKARFFLETVSEEQSKQQSLFDSNLLQPYIQFSEGRFLDFFGDMLSVPRRESTHAESGETNFYFYVDSGTFGDINSGAQIPIAAGTSVNTKQFQGDIITPGLSEQPIISYTTTEPVILYPDASFTYVPVRARIEGPYSTIPRNVLNQHPVENYTLAERDLLKCTNRYGIDNGDARETDAAYRFRLINTFRSRSKAVLSAIRIAALSVPGVSDVVPVRAEQGPGTFSLYVLSIGTAITSPNVLSEVAEAVATVESFGVRPYVLAPRRVGLELVCRVQWSSRATRDDITEGYIRMRDSLESYLNNRTMGEPVGLDDLVDILLSSSDSALSIGTESSNTFEEAYVYREDAFGSGVIRSKFLGTTIEPLYNEKVELETATKYRGIHFI